MIKHLPLLTIAAGAVFYLLLPLIESLLRKFFPVLANRIFPAEKMDLSIKLCKKCKGFPCSCTVKK